MGWFVIQGIVSRDSLQWRHNGHDGVSNHQPHDCLLNRLFRYRSKALKLRVTGLCAGKSPVTGEFPYEGPVTRYMFPFDDVIVWNFLLVRKSESPGSTKCDVFFLLITKPLSLPIRCNLCKFMSWSTFVQSDQKRLEITHRSITPKFVTPTAPSCIDNIIYVHDRAVGVTNLGAMFLWDNATLKQHILLSNCMQGITNRRIFFHKKATVDKSGPISARCQRYSGSLWHVGFLSRESLCSNISGRCWSFILVPL